MKLISTDYSSCGVIMFLRVILLRIPCGFRCSLTHFFGLYTLVVLDTENDPFRLKTKEMNLITFILTIIW